MELNGFFNLDCIEGIKQIPDKYFDLAIVDPPYGLDVGNMNMGIGKGKRASKIENRKWKPKNWDTDAPPPHYFNDLFRVSKNQIIWGGNYFDLKPCKNFVIWDKEIPEGLSFADCEMAWTSFNNSPKIFRRSVYIGKSERFHPTQKPVALYKWLLKNYAKPGDKILDTHVGSASSLIACHDLGFEYLGFELDPDYFKMATERLETHKSQLNMFVDMEGV